MTTSKEFRERRRAAIMSADLPRETVKRYYCDLLDYVDDYNDQMMMLYKKATKITRLLKIIQIANFVLLIPLVGLTIFNLLQP